MNKFEIKTSKFTMLLSSIFIIGFVFFIAGYFWVAILLASLVVITETIREKIFNKIENMQDAS